MQLVGQLHRPWAWLGPELLLKLTSRQVQPYKHENVATPNGKHSVRKAGIFGAAIDAGEESTLLYFQSWWKYLVGGRVCLQVAPGDTKVEECVDSQWILLCE